VGPGASAALASITFQMITPKHKLKRAASTKYRKKLSIHWVQIHPQTSKSNLQFAEKHCHRG